MEYSYADVERKFRESTVRATVTLAQGVNTSGYFYIHGMELDDEEVVRVTASKCPFTVGHKNYYISTGQRTVPTERYPKMVIHYWNPESGLYRGHDPSYVYLVQRRVRRSFCVGLNHHSYNIHRYDGGRLFDAHNASVVDPSRPRIFNNFDALSEKIYRLDSSLFFLQRRIGLIQNQQILLSDPDYLPFIPEFARGSCIQNF